jgi:hypothetical protein
MDDMDNGDKKIRKKQKQKRRRVEIYFCSSGLPISPIKQIKN